MTLNPLKAIRKWREHRQERRDALLRLRCLELYAHYGNHMNATTREAYLAYLFVKYGANKDGIPQREIFWPADRLTPYPEGPIKPE